MVGNTRQAIGFSVQMTFKWTEELNAMKENYLRKAERFYFEVKAEVITYGATLSKKKNFLFKCKDRRGSFLWNKLSNREGWL